MVNLFEHSDYLSFFFTNHTHVPGRSGSGKTRVLLRVVRDLVLAHYPVVVLDGKGEFYDLLIRFLTRIRVRPGRVTLIDPTARHAPGLNVLAYPNGVHPSGPAGLVVDLFQKFLRRQNEPQLMFPEYGTLCFTALAWGGLTLADASAFLDVTDPAFRLSVMAGVPDRALVRKMVGFEETYEKRPHEKANLLLSVKTRVDTIVRNPYLAAMFGQQTTTINWPELFNGDGILLANLGPSPYVGSEAPRFVGAALLHNISMLARPRNGGRYQKPLVVVMDEFQKFLTDDLADSLEQLRSAGVLFVMAHQHLAQLYLDHPRIYHAVISCARNKLCFGLDDPDAQVYHREIFAGMFYPAMQVPKDEIYQTKQHQRLHWLPVESHSESETEGGSEGWHNDSHNADGSSEGYTEVINPKNGEALSVPNFSRNSTAGTSSGSTWGTNWQRTRGTTKSLAPMLLPEEYQELTGRTFPTEAEVREEYVGKITTLPNQNFWWKFQHYPPVPTVVPLTYPDRVRPQDLAVNLDQLYATGTRPVDEVRRDIEERPHQYKNRDGEHDPDVSQPKRKR